MKRILVIDDSEVVRETLALILGSEFVIVKRPLTSNEFPIADSREVDLLIFGVTPQLGAETASLLRFAAQLPFAVLLLVESRSIASEIQTKAEVACLTKPFNPYELHQKVGQLLARRAEFSATGHFTPDHEDLELPYLDFPFLTRSAASLVRRFGAASLPLLISGEMGCGQARVAAAICNLGSLPKSRVVMNAVEIGEEYLGEKKLELSLRTQFTAWPTSLVIENLEKSSPAGQSMLLGFIEQVTDVRYVTTANTELLERVYRGEFLDSLYYRLATLTLKLSPLRERRDEIPVLAEWFARGYAKKLGVTAPAFSDDAKSRLMNYLWFGNLSEMEAVIARTLAFHRRSQIAGADLIFDFSVPQTADAV